MEFLPVPIKRASRLPMTIKAPLRAVRERRLWPLWIGALVLVLVATFGGSVWRLVFSSSEPKRSAVTTEAILDYLRTGPAVSTASQELVVKGEPMGFLARVSGFFSSMFGGDGQSGRAAAGGNSSGMRHGNHDSEADTEAALVSHDFPFLAEVELALDLSVPSFGFELEYQDFDAPLRRRLAKKRYGTPLERYVTRPIYRASSDLGEWFGDLSSPMRLSPRINYGGGGQGFGDSSIYFGKAGSGSGITFSTMPEVPSLGFESLFDEFSLAGQQISQALGRQ